MFSEIAECSAVGPPDWFVPRALTTTPWQLDSGGVGGCGLVAFCSKPYVHIFLLRGRSDGMNCGISYVGQIQPHHERISGLSFCVPGGGMLDTACLVTCGDDGLVRNWTYQSPDWLLTEELNVSSVKDKLTPTALSTCARGDDMCSMLSLIGTNTGHIIVWSHSEVSERTKCCSKRFENEAVQDCAWESKPGSSAVKMAIGYKKGIVGLYTYQSASVTSAPSLSQINRFYTHEKDICHISWSPYYGSDESADPVNPDLLTCGRDQFLKVNTL